MEGLKDRWERDFDVIGSIDEIERLGGGWQGEAYKVSAHDREGNPRSLVVKDFEKSLKKGGGAHKDNGFHFSLAAGREGIPHLAQMYATSRNATLMEYVPDCNEKELGQQSATKVAMLRITQTLDYFRTKTSSEWSLLDPKKANFRINPRTNELKIIDLDSAKENVSSDEASRNRRLAVGEMFEMLHNIKEMKNPDLRAGLDNIRGETHLSSVDAWGPGAKVKIGRFLGSKEFTDLPESLRLAVQHMGGLTEETRDFSEDGEEFFNYCERLQYLFLAYLGEKQPDALQQQKLPPILTERIKSDRKKHGLEQLSFEEFLSTAIEFHVEGARDEEIIDFPKDLEQDPKEILEAKLSDFLKVPGGFKHLDTELILKMSPKSTDWDHFRKMWGNEMYGYYNFDSLAVATLNESLEVADSRERGSGETDSLETIDMRKEPFERDLKAIQEELENRMRTEEETGVYKQHYLKVLLLQELLLYVEFWDDTTGEKLDEMFKSINTTGESIRTDGQKWNEESIVQKVRDIMNKVAE